MDPVRQLIAEKLKEHGLAMRDVSLKIGRNHSYLSEFQRGKITHLPEAERRRLARLLHVDEGLLRTAPLPEDVAAGKESSTQIDEIGGVREGPPMKNSEEILKVYMRLDAAGRNAVLQTAWEKLDELLGREGGTEPRPTRVRR